LAGALLFIEKIRQSSPLFWFGLRNDGILYLQAAIQRTIVDSPAFLEHGLAEKIAVCGHTIHTTSDPNKEDDWRHFCMKRLRTLISSQLLYSRSKLKNQKHIAVGCPF
jgi:hypothetical protein